MGKDLEIERFQRLLSELAEESNAESRPPSGPFAPLHPALENRLLQVSMTSASTAALPWYGRLWAWMKARYVRRIILPLLLVPTAAAVFIVLLVNRESQLQYARAPVLERRLRSGKSTTVRSADDRTLLSRTNQEVQERSELRIKRREVLSLLLPAVTEEKGPIAVRSFLRRDGVLKSWEVQPEQQADGSFLLLMPVRILPELGAEQDLLFAYGRPDSLPSLDELRAGKQPGADHRWYLQSLRLIVED